MAHAHEQKTTSTQYLCFRLAGEECAPAAATETGRKTRGAADPANGARA